MLLINYNLHYANLIDYSLRLIELILFGVDILSDLQIFDVVLVLKNAVENLISQNYQFML